MQIVHDPEPTPEDIRRVRAGLQAFNQDAAGVAEVRTFALYLKDEAAEIRGGLVGYFAWKWMYVDLLWVEQSLRGQGRGGALLRRAEELAREGGCIAAHLNTYEFQARPFYEHHGYEVYGTLEGFPAGTRTYHMKKVL